MTPADLSGPFMTATQITDSSADPGFAKLLPDAVPGTSAVSSALSRLDRAASRKAA